MAWPSASERVCEVRGGKRNPAVGERKKKQQLAPHQAAGIKVKWRRGITQLRLRFSFDCKNPDKSYYACKSVGGFLTLREWALNRERALRAERRVSDNLGKNESSISCWIRENPSQCWQKLDAHSHLSRHMHPQWLTASATVECTSIQRWGSITFSQKWGESKGQSHNRQRGLFCSVFRKWSEETSEEQNEEVRAKRRGREKKKSKNVPLHSTPFGKTGFWPQTAAIEILWLQLLIALTLCPWYVLAKHFQ